MTIDSFNHLHDRQPYSSQKWEKYAGKDILPLWVADTDFISPPSIINAVIERAKHGIFGYTNPPKDLIETVRLRLHKLYQWDVQPDDIEWLPGLVPGIHLACRSSGFSGSSVMTPCPVYPPFITAPGLSDRSLIKMPMKMVEKRLVIDFERLAETLQDDTRLVLFCNPHNPGGTVYRQEELQQLSDFVIQHDLIICSDEIHCELILEPGLKHIPIASLNPEIAARCITLMAPSKTFNIAGLGCSFAIIQNPELRKRFQNTRKGIVPEVNLMGFTAAQAAYQEGDEWNQQQLAYLRGNRDFLLEKINAIPGLSLGPIEGTYLAWIDIREAHLENPIQFFEEAGVGLSPGRDFGDAGFMRLNFGCPRALLEAAVDRINRAMLKHLPAS